MSSSLESTTSGMALVTKAGSILQLLAEHGELSVAQLSGHTGEPASSLYRLLAALEGLDWVEPGSRRGKIRLGLDLVRLGHALESQLDLRAMALPELRRIHDQTRQTVFLCVRRGLSATCIERIEGTDVKIQRLRLGDSMPLGQGVAPRAILAFESPEFIASYLAQMPVDENYGIIAADATELRDQLVDIARTGTSVSRGDLGPGIGGVGAPIFNHRKEVVGAVSISGLTHRVFDNDYDPVEVVGNAATRISRNLGAVLPAPMEFEGVTR